MSLDVDIRGEAIGELLLTQHLNQATLELKTVGINLLTPGRRPVSLHIGDVDSGVEFDLNEKRVEIF